MKYPIRQAAALIPLLWLAACGGPSTETQKEAAKDLKAIPAAPPADAASISGKVMFSGAKPASRQVSMDATPACSRQHKTPPVSEEVVVNADGSLRNVFVYVKDGLPEGQKWAAPPDPLTIDQVGCVYKPHVAGVMAGQEIRFLNSDPTNHNIHPLPRVNREWNQSQPPNSDAIVKSFPLPEIMIPIKCNLHPWMRVYVGVVAHPFFGVTGEDGTFSLKGLPPGEYTIEAWHERFDKQEAKVKVGPKEEGKAGFTFKG